ncbi:MAG: hypothetical protein RLO08_19135 [Parvibaculaceae bacterium]
MSHIVHNKVLTGADEAPAAACALVSRVTALATTTTTTITGSA